MTKESPTLTDDDSEYDGPTSPPPAPTIRTRSKTNRVKIKTPKPHVTFDKNSLKSGNIEKIKSKKSSIKLIKKPGGKGKGTAKVTKPGVPKEPAALGTQNSPTIEKLKDKNKKKSDKLKGKNKSKQKKVSYREFIYQTPAQFHR